MKYPNKMTQHGGQIASKPVWVDASDFSQIKTKNTSFLSDFSSRKDCRKIFQYCPDIFQTTSLS